MKLATFPWRCSPSFYASWKKKCLNGWAVNNVIQSDFRLIAATNQNLEQLIEQGRFRRDLYYRINVMSLAIPPLKMRIDDIIPIARHLLRQSTQGTNSDEIRLSQEAINALVNHPWPGNVRELSNVLDRALSTMNKDVIELADLPFMFQKKPASSVSTGISTIREAQAEAERSTILAALEQTANNKAKAASLLGIHRTLLYKKMKKHGIGLSGNG